MRGREGTGQQLLLEVGGGSAIKFYYGCEERGKNKVGVRERGREEGERITKRVRQAGRQADVRGAR